MGGREHEFDPRGREITSLRHRAKLEKTKNREKAENQRPSRFQRRKIRRDVYDVGRSFVRGVVKCSFRYS